MSKLGERPPMVAPMELVSPNAAIFSSLAERRPMLSS
jgi:hypothetical protein